jgi:hypothetical protein
MKLLMVRYRVKADRVADNVRYIESVFAELERSRPSGLRYASFKLADGVSFVHLAAMDTPDGSNPLTALPAFQEFSARIKDRCDEPPAAVELEQVGAYRAFADAS